MCPYMTCQPGPGLLRVSLTCRLTAVGMCSSMTNRHRPAYPRIVAAHRRHGTTALMPTLLSDTPAKKCAQRCRRFRSLPAGSGVLGIHFEGPFLSPEKPGVHDPAMLRRPTSDDLSLLACPATRYHTRDARPRASPGWLHR